jgi:hypothetical protein
MYLSPANSAIPKPNHGDTFEFPPAGFTVLPTESHDLADSAPRRDNLNVLDLTGQLEMHYALPIPFVLYLPNVQDNRRRAETLLATAALYPPSD